MNTQSQTTRTAPDFNAQRTAAHDYAQRCQHLRDAGLKPVVIRRRDNPHEWRDWRAYFRSRGLNASLAMMDENEWKAVPTRSPYEFEPVKPVPDRRLVD